MVTSTLLPFLTTVTLLFTVVAGSCTPAAAPFSAANASEPVIVVFIAVVAAGTKAVSTYPPSTELTIRGNTKPLASKLLYWDASAAISF